MLEATSGVRDSDLRDFIKEVREFGQELRRWLEQLDAARTEQLRPFSARARVSEHGRAAADFTWLYLRFPQEFEETKRPPDVPGPPKRPQFTSRLGFFHSPVEPLVTPKLGRRLQDLFAQKDQPATAASYSSEDGSTLISFQVGHIKQHVHRDTSSFELNAPAPGHYEVDWQISAAGLSPPAEGKIKIEVREPEHGEPITTLREALAERKRCELD